jgi:integrase
VKTGTLATQAQTDKFLRQDGRGAISDQQVRGLQLERLSADVAKWRFRYAHPNGRGRRCLTLGDAQSLTLADARTIANQYKLKIAMGADPVQEKANLRAVPTFANFMADRYMPFVKGYKRSWVSDDSYLRNHLLPALGKKHLDEIGKHDVIAFHHGMKAKGYALGTCNRCLILLRYAMNLALRWETPGLATNPTAGVALFEDPPMKERFLTPEEARRLYEQVKRSDNSMLQFIVPMLILTGARKREVLDARWEDFDLPRRQWRIPMSKTGRPRHIPLSDGVLQLLAAVPRDDSCPWVFANPRTKKPYVSIFNAWDTARARAGLADVRIHDLRHSFASFLVNAGRSLYEVQKILGHTQVKTTQRYAHLAQETLIDACNSVVNSLGDAFGPMSKKFFTG